MTEINAVFEGGGVKGIALVGALARSTTEELDIRGYAGSSAGAIVAAFANAGYNTTELEDLLKETNYMNFLDGSTNIPLGDLKECVKEILGLLDGGNLATIKQEMGTLWAAQESWFAGIRTWRAWRKLKKRHKKTIDKIGDRSKLIKAIIEQLSNGYGLYGTQNFLEWLQGHLNNKGVVDDLSHNVTFGSLYRQACSVENLRELRDVV
jgi:predicted acylesterase/phospholipase RssA